MRISVTNISNIKDPKVAAEFGIMKDGELLQFQLTGKEAEEAWNKQDQKTF